MDRSVAGTDLSEMKNVVVVLQENHTFDDDYFRLLPGADGTAGMNQVPGSAKRVSPFHDPNITPVEMNRGHVAARADYDWGEMDAFVYTEKNNETMGFTTKETWPLYWRAAQARDAAANGMLEAFDFSQPARAFRPI